MARTFVFLACVSALLQATWSIAIAPNDVAIIGGDVISIDAAPYMAALFLDDHQQCGASIIDDQFVLTAAHCLAETEEIDGVWSKEPNGNWSVLVGSDQLNSDGLFIKVRKIVCHEEFDKYENTNDICLLKLDESIEFGCIWTVDRLTLPPDDREIVEGTEATVTGWGYTEDGTISNKLRQTTVPVVPNGCCRDAHPNVTKDMMCAGSEGHNFCLQDGGSPLSYKGMVIGVASWDSGDCDQIPGVYTRVASYLDWIKDTVYYN